jgi:transposase
VVRFLDPSPEGILIGSKTLKEYLGEREETGIFVLRDFLHGLDWTRFTARYKAGGRPPYHPAVMVGIIVWGLMQGVSSLRGLEKVAQMDVRCWWLSGGVEPDHSALGEFINLHREELTGGFFDRVTRETLRATQSSGTTLAGDGTVVQAAASRYGTIKREAALQAAARARQAAEAQPQDEALQRRAGQAKKVAEAAEARERKRREQRHANAGEVSVSRQEPEAVIQPLKTKAKVPAYRPSILANRDQIVVAKAVHPSCETEVVKQLLEQAREVSGPVETLLLDAGYFQGSVLQMAVEDPGLENLLCPEGKTVGDGPWEKASGHEFPKSRFVYEEWADQYRCPGGQYLKPTRWGSDRGKRYRVYRSGACRDCPLRGQCTKSRRGREINRWEDEDLKDAMREVMKQPQARAQYRQRKAMVEPVFGRLKQGQGLTRFRRFGLSGVILEFSLHLIAYNLDRLLHLAPQRAAQGLFSLGLHALTRLLRGGWDLAVRIRLKSILNPPVDRPETLAQVA